MEIIYNTVQVMCRILCSKYTYMFSISEQNIVATPPPLLNHDPGYCPLHISRSDAPIGLRCSRRQIGTKPSDVASAPHSHCPNSAQCVHSRRLVRGCHTILYDSLACAVTESFLLQFSVALYTLAPDRPAASDNIKHV